MGEQSYGLRFDIYERIHLSEDVVGIEELEEIELLPKIQVVPGEEYAALRGHLLLSGLYRGEGETRELTHWIPVEITIPLSRVNRLDEIAVEIENFDVDLLSARSLNVTGVLSLKGVESSSSLPAEPEGWSDREYTAEHVVSDQYSFPFSQDQAESEFNSQTEVLEQDRRDDWRDNAIWQSQVRNTDEQHEQVSDSAAWTDKIEESEAEDDDTLEESESGLESTEVESESGWFKEESGFNRFKNAFVKQGNADNTEEPKQAESSEEVSASPISESESESASEISAEPVWPPVDELENGDLETERVEDNEITVQAQVEEKKELKIALGSSKKSNDLVKVENYGLTNLISSNRTGTQDHVPAVNDSGPVEGNTDSSDSEKLLWKNMFIRNTEDQAPFRQVKIVIVQREETLEDIAQRYHLSSRELQLYNRLSEHQLAEGQVLYIP